MYKVLLRQTAQTGPFAAQAGLRHSSTQRTSRIIDPGGVDYFFSHSGRLDANAQEISASISRSMCAFACVQTSPAWRAENELLFLVFPLK